MSYAMLKDLGETKSEGFNNLGIGSGEKPRKMEKYSRNSGDSGTMPTPPPMQSGQSYSQNQPMQQPMQQKSIPSGVRNPSTIKNPASASSSQKFAVPVKNIDHKIDLINNHRISVIDVWAPWCNPCLMIADKYEELAKKYNKRGECILAKENLEDKIEQPEGTVIRGIPTFLFFKDGVHIDTEVGADLGSVETKLQQLLNEN